MNFTNGKTPKQEINPAILDMRDERAAQDRKLLRIEALKATSTVLGTNKDITMSDIINESNKVYAFLDNGTIQQPTEEK